MLAAVIPAFIGALALDFLFLPLRNGLRRRRPAQLYAPACALLAIVSLRLIPVFVFIGISLTLIDQNEAHKFPRFIILNLVYAITLWRILDAVARGLFAPTAEALRLLPVSDKQAAYGHRWVSAFGFVIIYGYFLVDVARSIHVPGEVITAFGNVLGLALVLMTLLVIVQKRAAVATFLRGTLSAAQPDLTTLQLLAPLVRAPSLAHSRDDLFNPWLSDHRAWRRITVLP